MKKLPDDLTEKLLAVSDQLSGTGLDVSVDDVAALTRVPRATLYYYFSGKDDLVGFYLTDKLERIGGAIAKAAAGEGSVADRLGAALTAILHALAEHPAVCVELPVAVKESGTYADVIAAADRIVMTPLRELLLEGKASGELVVADVPTAAQGLMGALNFVGMIQIVRTGGIDVDATAPMLVPQLVDGLRPR